MTSIYLCNTEIKKQEKKKKRRGKTKERKRLQRKKGGKIVYREHFPVSGWARLTVSTNSQSREMYMLAALCQLRRLSIEC